MSGARDDQQSGPMVTRRSALRAAGAVAIAGAAGTLGPSEPGARRRNDHRILGFRRSALGVSAEGRLPALPEEVP